MPQLLITASMLTKGGMIVYPLCPIVGKASTLATPFHDPITESIDEYQAFLKALGYSPLAKAAYGKKVR